MLDIKKHLVQVFEKEDKELEESDKQITEICRELNESEEQREMYNIATKLSYLITAQRGLINRFQASYSMFQNKDLNQTSVLMIQKRETALIKRSERLTQLREDLKTVQSLVYVQRYKL